MEAQFGGRLGPISCFLKVLPFPSSEGGSVMTTRVHFLSGSTWMPPFRVVISPALWFLSQSLQVLPSPASLPTTDRKLGSTAHKRDGEPEASHGFTQYSLNCSISATA